MINLAQAVGIVLVVLAVTMGLRMAVIIGLSGLIFAILGTFILMAGWEIDLQRVSLGALIIAMGMMVDNAIVVADGFVVRLQRGMDRTQAAWALLAATLVATMAFYPIFASDFDTGEYAGSLFVVVGIALLFSWLLSQTVTPLMCMNLIPDPKDGGEGSDPYGGKFYQRFRGLLATVIRARFFFIGSLLALLVISIWGFRFVPQMFFPDSSRLQFMIDYWEPEGSRIQDVSANLAAIEEELVDTPGVESVSAFIGGGPPRFYLPVNPEDPYPSYGQLIVNTGSLQEVDTAMDHITPWIAANVPQALVRVRKYGVGAWDDWKFEARFSGPAEADPDVLRRLGEQGMAILEASPYADEVRTNWRNRVRRIVPEYNQERGRWAGVDREDLASATKRSFDGISVGLYREGDDLIPIVFRDVEAERRGAASDMDRIQILPTLFTESVPLSQVTDAIAVEWEDPLIWRWDRRRAITVRASPDEATAPTLMQDVRAAFEAIELPPGYSLEFDGEYGSTNESQAALDDIERHGKKHRKWKKDVLSKAARKNSLRALNKLTDVVDGRRVIVPDPPLIVRIDEELAAAETGAVTNFFESYRETLPLETRVLLDRFSLVDIAKKIVGVGSVGTRCLIMLIEAGDGTPLFLQLKQAVASVLEPHLGASVFEQAGQRVVEGQRLIQATSDVLLGWSRFQDAEGREIDFYLRQLWDGKGKIDVDELGPKRLAAFAGICGKTLAFAHARSGDAMLIRGYIGDDETFDDAMIEFADRYADRTERDHAQLSEAIEDGAIEVIRDI